MLKGLIAVRNHAAELTALFVACLALLLDLTGYGIYLGAFIALWGGVFALRVKRSRLGLGAVVLDGIALVPGTAVLVILAVDALQAS